MNKLLSRLKHNLIDDWYIEGDPTSKDRLRLLKCQYTSNVIRALFQGTFWTGLLLCMNADDASIGTLSMISCAAGMLQLLGPMFLEHFRQRKRMLIIMRGFMWFFDILAIGLLPLLPVGPGLKMGLLIACMLLFNILNTFVAPGVAVWHIQSIPERVRGGYYSLFTMTNGAITAIAAFIGGVVVDAFAGADMQYYGLLTLRITACLLCAYELYMYTKIPEYPYGDSKTAGFSPADLLIKPLKNKRYLLTVLVGFSWYFVANMPGSYYSVYLLSDVGMSYSYISLISALNVPFILLLTPLWKKLLKRLGWFETLARSMAAYTLVFGMMAFVTKQNGVYVYALSQLTAYFFSIGISLSFNGVPWVNIPKENQSVFYAFYQTVLYLGGFLGSAVGKRFVIGIGAKTAHILGMNLGGKQLLMLLTALALTAGALAVELVHRRVHDTME